LGLEFPQLEHMISLLSGLPHSPQNSAPSRLSA
jgi:hypothetical protein